MSYTIALLSPVSHTWVIAYAMRQSYPAGVGRLEAALLRDMWFGNLPPDECKVVPLPIA